MLFVLTLYVLFMLFLLVQGVLVLYLNLYIWMSPDRLQSSQSPKKYLKPKVTFTLMLPALHEEDVLGETIRRASSINYPNRLYEILIILQPTDKGTIKVAREAIKKYRIKNAKVLIVDGKHKPLNKPYQLNYALKRTKNKSIVIFDSEDDMHKDILNIANTLYRQRNADIIQCGVQLMDYDANWFAAHAVLEYYFWFKSRQHAHMKAGAVPLGGNTVFFKTNQVRSIGGWNEACLCEDAEIGMRLSVKGAKMISTYDPRHVTREEVPSTTKEFVKQRTRWCQGFVQILQEGSWRKLPSRLNGIMAVYLLGSPYFLAAIVVLGFAMFFIGQAVNLPLGISIISFVPFLLAGVTTMVQMAGLYDFIREQNLKLKIWPFLAFPFTLGPYILMLCIGAVRGLWRQYKGQNNWEKTYHSGAHRKPGDA